LCIGKRGVARVVIKAPEVDAFGVFSAVEEAGMEMLRSVPRVEHTARVREAVETLKWAGNGATRRLKPAPDQVLIVPFGLALLVAAWEAVTRLAAYPAFILPGPGLVAWRFVIVAADGSLWFHAQITLGEALGGFALGFVVATCLGYVLAKSPRLEKLLAPYIVASQSIPIVALAPLLVLWFGFGLTSKVVVSALIVFFPILVNTVVGLRSVDTRCHELMRSFSASPWQVFTKLEVPASLPVLFGGIRVGITLSVIGAVVGEFVGADQGLGFLVNVARGLYDTPLMFVALLTLMVIALTLYSIVAVLERTLISWPR
jgi:NitT/TauT family transport system permease protein